MLHIGLTGGIGSGKTVVAELFAARGAPVIDADAIVHELMAPGSPAYEAIVDEFGTDMLTPGGEIDRARLRARVFDDTQARRRLEAILHPRVRAIMAERAARLDAPYVILVIPLLFEAGQRDLVDRALVVDADEATQIARVQARSGLDPDAIRRIMAAQLDREARRRQADDIIVNDRDFDHLAAQVERLHRSYLGMTKTSSE
ncbi:MAG TPA: dephospho-CoA kinase [Acidiferrobacterales bacterium]|jgi:dephospho-CoA kinase